MHTLSNSARSKVAHQICRCCGQRMTEPSPCNINICLDCEQMVFDDSPIIAAEVAKKSLRGMPAAGSSGAEESLPVSFSEQEPVRVND